MQYTITVSTLDYLGNRGTNTSSFTINTNAPDIMMTYPIGSPVYTNNENQYLAGDITAYQGRSISSVLIDSTNITDTHWDGTSFDYPLTISTKTYSIKAIDDIGNEATEEIRFELDNLNPSLNLHPHQQLTNRNTIILEGTYFDSNFNRIEVNVNGTSYTNDVIYEGFNGYSVNITLLEGQNYVEIVAYDLAGNTATKNTSIILDQYISEPILYGLPSPINYRINISGTCDFGSTVTLLINYEDGPKTSVSAIPDPLSVSINSGGINPDDTTVQQGAQVTFMNQLSIPVNISGDFEAELAPSETVIYNLDELRTYSYDVEVSVTTTYHGIIRVEPFVNEFHFTNFDAGIDLAQYNPQPDGYTYDIMVSCQDAAGNIGVSDIQQIVYDKTKPELVTGEPVGTINYLSPVQIIATGSDGYSIIPHSVNVTLR
jgi:hypothetical protein